MFSAPASTTRVPWPAVSPAALRHGAARRRARPPIPGSVIAMARVFPTPPMRRRRRTPAAYWARAREIARHEGLPGLTWRMAVKGASPLGLLELANLYERDLALPVAPARMKVGVALAQATPADARVLAVLTA